METTPLVADYLIILSKSAISKLGLDKNVELRNIITNACINFRHYSADSANQALFTLFYGKRINREEILWQLFKRENYHSIDGECKIPAKKFSCFTEEGIQVLANELLYQYSAAHPNFLVVESISSECKKEFNALKASMSDHPVLFYRTVEMCKTICHVEHIASLGILLLLSKNSICQQSGLEVIGFNFQHRILLRPYAKEIGLLLQAMNAIKVPNTSTSPFATWLNQHEENDFTINKLPQYLLLSEFENFLNGNSELISNLPCSKDLKTCLNSFRDNLNVLLEKEEYLQFTNRLVTLLYARRYYQEAQDYFSMGNEESLMNLSRSIRNLENANAYYNSALNCFIKSCS